MAILPNPFPPYDGLSNPPSPLKRHMIFVRLIHSSIKQEVYGSSSGSILVDVKYFSPTVFQTLGNFWNKYHVLAVSNFHTRMTIEVTGLAGMKHQRNIIL